MATETRELSLGVLDGLHCEGCPRLRGANRHSAFPPPIHEYCPRDYLIQELGSNPTADQVVGAAKKRQFIFKKAENDNLTHISWITLSCPNKSRTFEGSLLLYTYAPQKLVERFIENLPGAMIQGKLEL